MSGDMMATPTAPEVIDGVKLYEHFEDKPSGFYVNHNGRRLWIENQVLYEHIGILTILKADEERDPTCTTIYGIAMQQAIRDAEDGQ
jgi:hypothetical protein